MAQRKLLAAIAVPGLAVALAACGSSTSSSNSGGGTGSGTPITVTAVDFSFTPSTLNLTAGQKYTITFVNKGSKEHDLTLGGTDVGEADAGATKTLDYTPSTGATGFWCKYHKTSNNMVGTLAVSGTGGPAPGQSTAPQSSSSAPYGY